MSGRSRASSCISISSRWRASGASAIASMGTAAAKCMAPAMSTPSSRSTITVGPPTSKSCPRRPPPRRRASSPAPSSGLRGGACGSARCLPTTAASFCSHVFRHVAHARAHRPAPHPAVPPANQWQSRALHPNAHSRQWAYAVAYPSSWRRTRALRPWLRHYNLERPHAALGYQPPCVRFPRLAQ